MVALHVLWENNGELRVEFQRTVWYIAPQFTVSSLLHLKHNLRSDSTILFLQNGMGVIDEINKHVFPNVASRPNYVIGDPRCSLWTPQGTAILEMPVKGTELISALADPILQQLEEEEVQQNIKFSFIGGRCSIHIGPVVLNKEKEIDRIRKREISSLYLRNALVEAPGLGVKLVGQHQLSYRKLRLLAIESIFQGLTMLYECQNSEVFRTLNGRRLVEGLFRETAAVTTAFFPTLNYNTLLHSMQIHIMNRSNHVSELIAIPTRGLLTPVDYKNGVIVKHAKELGFRCPLHGRVTEMVKRKTVEAKLYFADEKLRKNQEAYKQRRTFYQEERKEEKTREAREMGENPGKESRIENSKERATVHQDHA
ncbi:hypothetical protein G7Y89_g5765 [Cudoniella acicularis]|uniref:Ketopantoate reductase C-terminal domain-containing protein n=1 Tax=Cudoniella acicularis TaxID=354080 RepID=A0A8H4RLW7_9HELO|nr:hypothetical protein G7Y89_g5765 [Cudoniella acicularis]